MEDLGKLHALPCKCELCRGASVPVAQTGTAKKNEDGGWV